MSDLQMKTQDKKPGAVKAVLLDQWIEANSSFLKGPERGTLAHAADAASKDLGFRVPCSMLRTLMQSRGMETKRVSRPVAEKMALMAENERLSARNLQLTRILGMLYVSEQVGDDIKELVFGGIDAEVMEAIKSRG